MKRYISALQGLEQQLGKLQHQTEAEKIIYQVTAGSLRELTAAHKANLLAVAGEIDIRNAHILVLDSEQAHLVALYNVITAGEAIRNNAAVTAREQMEAYEFETSLIGKTTQEVLRMNAERQIELQLRSQLRAAAAAAGDNNEQYYKEEARLRAIAAVQRDQLIPAVKARYDMERTASAGINAALNRYIEDTSTAARQYETLWTNAFKGMEDALVNFVKTGKLDFKSLADGIITDLIRIQIQQSITGPLSGAIKSAGGASGIFSSVKSFFNFADGGIMSAAGSMPLNRYASGGIASSPQLAMFGEGSSPEAYVPLPDGRSIPVTMRGGAGGGDIVVNQPITINAQNASAETVGQIRALMPGLIAENKRVVESVIQQAMQRRGGRLAA
jgi:lambda family phage tail tape measure protein